MPALLRTCCGCCELRVGVIIIAVLELCLATLGVYSSYNQSEARRSQFRNFSKDTYNQTVHEKTAIKTDRVLFMTEMGIGSIDLLASALLLLGAVLNKPKYRLINHFWIAWTGLVVGVLMVSLVVKTIATVSSMRRLRLFIQYGGVILLESYCILVVFSYHVQLRNTARGPIASIPSVRYTPTPSLPDINATEHEHFDPRDAPPPYEIAVELPPAYSEQDFSFKDDKNRTNQPTMVP